MSDQRPSAYDLNCLEAGIRPYTLRHYPTLTSTHDRAKEDVESACLRAPAIVVADTQTNGRGRGTNTWWSGTGNMAVTFVVQQNRHLAFGLVPLLAGLAVRRSLVRVTDNENVQLKWPNDVVINGRKLAGLLCERLQQVDLIGVGINVNAGNAEAPPELRNRMASLREETGRAWDLTEILREVSHDMSNVISVNSQAAATELLAEYASHHWPTGRDITIMDTDEAPQISGRCLGVDEQGRLLIRTNEGTRSCLTGSVAFVGPDLASG